MNLEQLANLGEFLGGIAVIISLIYVAIQIRGNSRIQRSESYGRSLEMLRDVQARFATDDEYARMYNRGLVEPEALSVEDRLKFTWACTEMFGAFEYMHHQYLQGDMPEEIWVRWEQTLRFWLTYPGIRTWWVGRPTVFSETFTALCDRYLQEDYRLERPKDWESWLRSGTVAVEKTGG